LVNDGAKGFLNGPTTATVVYESVGITVYRPAYEQLLAMKLCAWRDDVDISDARRIAAELPKSREETWRLVEPFLEPGKELKARYAFDDLWESQ